jgi:hypothetical protein
VSSRYNIVIPSDAPPWAQRLQADFNRVFAQIEGDLRTPTLAAANLPADGTRTLAIVSDEAGGAVLAFYDGADWRRVTDRAVVS